MHNYHRVLTIAGSDSGGGAGIQADLKTVSALGCYGLSVITALTAQNTTGVQAIHGVPADFIAAQLHAVLEDIGADAVKIGMLHSPAVIHAVADGLARGYSGPLVVDPVMVAKGGAKLLQDDAIQALREYLLPQATVITPNIPEAETLLGYSINDHNTMLRAARQLAALGPAAVLIKGGHLEGDSSCDCLYLTGTDKLHTFEAPRITTVNTHGTGCSLSAAIAAHLARGLDLVASVQAAKSYLSAAIAAGAGYRLGHGHGPVHHFHGLWSSDS